MSARSLIIKLTFVSIFQNEICHPNTSQKTEETFHEMLEVQT